MTIAEESTSWPKVSQPVHDGGLGFGFKWNMGFMHDTLQLSRPRAGPPQAPSRRADLRPALRLQRRISCCRSRHDEVVHGKGTLLTKMAGDDWQKFANLRAYYALHVGLSRQEAAVHGPGIRPTATNGARRSALDWHLLDIRAPCRRAAAGPRPEPPLPRKPALHARDCEPRRLSLADRRRRANSVFAWLRKAPGGTPVAVISQFHAGARATTTACRCPPAGTWREIINTDASDYGGSGMGNVGAVVRSQAGEGGRSRPR